MSIPGIRRRHCIRYPVPSLGEGVPERGDDAGHGHATLGHLGGLDPTLRRQHAHHLGRAHPRPQVGRYLAILGHGTGVPSSASLLRFLFGFLVSASGNSVQHVLCIRSMSQHDLSFVLATMMSKAGFGSVMVILLYLATFLPFALFMILGSSFKHWHKILSVRKLEV